jgi:hypothetical protein
MFSSIPEWTVQSPYMVTLPYRYKKVFRSTLDLAIPQRTGGCTLNNFSAQIISWQSSDKSPEIRFSNNSVAERPIS